MVDMNYHGGEVACLQPDGELVTNPFFPALRSGCRYQAAQAGHPATRQTTTALDESDDLAAGKTPDAVIASTYGIGYRTVVSKRRSLGITGYSGK